MKGDFRFPCTFSRLLSCWKWEQSSLGFFIICCLFTTKHKIRSKMNCLTRVTHDEINFPIIQWSFSYGLKELWDKRRTFRPLVLVSCYHCFSNHQASSLMDIALGQILGSLWSPLSLPTSCHLAICRWETIRKNSHHRRSRQRCKNSGKSCKWRWWIGKKTWIQ